MSTYPVFTAGMRLTAALLTSMQPQTFIKASTLDRINNTIADDPDLDNIALAIGTWHIKFLGFVTSVAATADLKTRWSFTGTWNTPIRACIGPGSTQTAARNIVDTSTYAGYGTATDAVYGLAAGAGFYCFTEQAYEVNVSVAGNLAFQWAQNTTDAANATSLKAGSTFEIRQIA